MSSSRRVFPLSRLGRVVLVFGCVACLLLPTFVGAQTVTLRLSTDRPVIAPGEPIVIDAVIDNPAGDTQPLGGYQIAVGYPTQRVALSTAPQALAFSQLTNSYTWSAPSPIGGGFAACPNWSDGVGTDIVSALGAMDPMLPVLDEHVHLFQLSFSTTAIAGETDTFTINNFEEFCAQWSSSIVVDPAGALVPTSRQGVSVTVSSLPPVTGLVCTPGLSGVDIAWDSSAGYDVVRLYRDGEFVANFGATETTYFDLDVLFSQTYTYAIVGVIAGQEAPYTISTVTMPSSVPPVGNLDCMMTAPGTVSVSWQNFGVYDSIEVSRDGSLLATLSGAANSYVDTGAPTMGTVEYAVVGVQGGRGGLATTCEVSLDGVTFIRGDANSDGATNVTDVSAGLNHIFGITVASCPDAIDFDDSGTLDVTDPINLAQYLFASGSEPPAPFPNPGPDPTADSLGCQ